MTNNILSTLAHAQIAHIFGKAAKQPTLQRDAKLLVAGCLFLLALEEDARPLNPLRLHEDVKPALNFAPDRKALYGFLISKDEMVCTAYTSSLKTALDCITARTRSQRVRHIAQTALDVLTPERHAGHWAQNVYLIQKVNPFTDLNMAVFMMIGVAKEMKEVETTITQGPLKDLGVGETLYQGLVKYHKPFMHTHFVNSDMITNTLKALSELSVMIDNMYQYTRQSTGDSVPIIVKVFLYLFSNHLKAYKDFDIPDVKNGDPQSLTFEKKPT